MKRIVKAILIYVGAILISTEIVLRFFDPFGFNYYRDVAKYHHDILVADTVMVYRQQPNSFTGLEYFSIQTNSAGARWHEYPSKIDLLVLGDSVVLGWGVRLDSTFVSLLNADAVMGVGSWNSHTQTCWFMASGLRPQKLLWVITANDIEVKQRFKPANWQSWFYRNSVTTALYWHLKQSIKRSDEIDFLPTYEWRNAVTKMAMFCDANDIKLIPVFYGLNDDVYCAYRDVFLNASIKLERFPKQVYLNRVSHIDGHPNSAGHRAMAEFIKEIL